MTTGRINQVGLLSDWNDRAPQFVRSRVAQVKFDSGLSPIRSGVARRTIGPALIEGFGEGAGSED